MEPPGCSLPPPISMVGRPNRRTGMKKIAKRRLVDLGRASLVTKSVWVGTRDEFTTSYLRYP